MERREEIRRTEIGSRKISEAQSIAPKKSGQAVGFNKRIEEANFFGLQPHILKLWLKPTAIKNLQPRPTGYSGRAATCNLQRKIRISTVFYITLSGKQGAIYQYHRQLGLPVDLIINN